MNVLWTVCALLTMLVGLVGTVIPGVPGIPLIYAAMLGYGALTGWQHYGAGAMIFWGVITGLSLAVEYVAGSEGARRFGASAFGIWGSIVGAIIGALVGHLPGLASAPSRGPWGRGALFGQALEGGAEIRAGGPSLVSSPGPSSSWSWAC